MEEHLFEKWLTPCLNILFIKIKIKYPIGQNLEIMTFRYLKTLVFDKFLKNYNIWCFYTILFPIYTYPPHSFQENWHDYKKFWRFHYAMLMLALLLVLHFSYYTLVPFLMMLSVILLSMLMILFSTLSVIRHLIYGNS